MAVSKEDLIIQLKTHGVKLTKAQLKQLDAQVKTTTASMGAMGSMMKGMAFVGLGMGMAKVISIGKEFQQTMADVAAVSGLDKTSAQFVMLEKQARALGGSTVHTASAVAGLMKEYSKLGFVPQEIMNMTEGTLALATATGEELDAVASVAGTTMRGFGLEAESMNEVVNVMAASFSGSALDLTKFTDSMKYVAPIAKATGMDLTGTTAVLGELANAGIDGSMAGTSLRKILLEAGKEGSKLAQRMGGPITSFEDFQQKMVALKEQGLDPISDGADLVGARAVTAFSILLEGADTMGELSDSFAEAAENGEVFNQQQKMMETFSGSIEMAKSAMSELSITIFDMSEGPLKGMVDTFTKFIQSIDEEEIKAYATAFAAVGVVMVGLKVKARLAAMEVATLNAVLAANPFGLVAIGAGLLLGSVIDLSGAMETSKTAAELEAEAQMEAAKAKEEHDAAVQKLTESLEGHSLKQLFAMREANQERASEFDWIYQVVSAKEDLIAKEQDYYDLLSEGAGDMGQQDEQMVQFEMGMALIDETIQSYRDLGKTNREIFAEMLLNHGEAAQGIRHYLESQDDSYLATLASTFATEAQIQTEADLLILEGELNRIKSENVDITDEVINNIMKEIDSLNLETEAIEGLIVAMQIKAEEEKEALQRSVFREEAAAIKSLESAYLDYSTLKMSEEEKAYMKSNASIDKSYQKQLMALSDITAAELIRLEFSEKYQKASSEEQAALKAEVFAKSEEEQAKLEKVMLDKKGKLTAEYFANNGSIMQQYNAADAEAKAKELERIEALKEAYGELGGVIVHNIEKYAEMAAEGLNTAQGVYDGIKNIQKQQHQATLNNIQTQYNTDLKKLKASDDYKKKSDRAKANAEEKLLEEKEKKEKAVMNKIALAEYEQAKVAKWVGVAQIIIETALASVKALPNVPLSIAVGALGAVSAGVAAATPIPPPVLAQFGYEGVVDRPTNFTVGEGNNPELVQVTPLVDENRFGPESGTTLNISFEGNVMSDDFIIDEAIPKIREAILRGESIS